MITMIEIYTLFHTSAVDMGAVGPLRENWLERLVETLKTCEIESQPKFFNEAINYLSRLPFIDFCKKYQMITNTPELSKFLDIDEAKNAFTKYFTYLSFTHGEISTADIEAGVNILRASEGGNAAFIDGVIKAVRLLQNNLETEVANSQKLREARDAQLKADKAEKNRLRLETTKKDDQQSLEKGLAQIKQNPKDLPVFIQEMRVGARELFFQRDDGKEFIRNYVKDAFSFRRIAAQLDHNSKESFRSLFSAETLTSFFHNDGEMSLVSNYYPDMHKWIAALQSPQNPAVNQPKSPTKQSENSSVKKPDAPKKPEEDVRPLLTKLIESLRPQLSNHVLVGISRSKKETALNQLIQDNTPISDISAIYNQLIQTVTTHRTRLGIFNNSRANSSTTNTAVALSNALIKPEYAALRKALGIADNMTPKQLRQNFDQKFGGKDAQKTESKYKL